jgi:hypothetical protein
MAVFLSAAVVANNVTGAFRSSSPICNKFPGCLDIKDAPGLSSLAPAALCAELFEQLLAFNR